MSGHLIQVIDWAGLTVFTCFENADSILWKNLLKTCSCSSKFLEGNCQIKNSLQYYQVRKKPSHESKKNFFKIFIFKNYMLGNWQLFLIFLLWLLLWILLFSFKKLSFRAQLQKNSSVTKTYVVDSNLMINCHKKWSQKI